MPFLTKGKTNWKYILIVVILTLVVGGISVLQWQKMIKEMKVLEITVKKPQEQVIKGVIENFYNAFKKQEGRALMSYFTSPMTNKEKESYEWLIGADLSEPRVALDIKISSYSIEKIKRIERDKFQVSVKEEIQIYTNRWNTISRKVTFIVAKVEDKWLIDKYVWEHSLWEFHTQKYSGFGHEEILIDVSTWKTYKNQKYGYEVKYPKRLIVKDYCSTYYCKKSLNAISFFSPNEEGHIFGIYVYDAQNLSSIQWLNFYSASTGCTIPFGKRALVSGVEGIRGLISCGNIVSEGVFLLRENKIYHIESATRVKDHEIEMPKEILGQISKLNEIFNQMLSTFRFLE